MWVSRSTPVTHFADDIRACLTSQSALNQAMIQNQRRVLANVLRQWTHSPNFRPTSQNLSFERLSGNHTQQSRLRQGAEPFKPSQPVLLSFRIPLDASATTRFYRLSLGHFPVNFCNFSTCIRFQFASTGGKSPVTSQTPNRTMHSKSSEFGSPLTTSPHTRRDGRVADCAALEMLCPGNRTGGSNPPLSA